MNWWEMGLTDLAKQQTRLLWRIEVIDEMLADKARHQTVRGMLRRERRKLWAAFVALRLES